MRLVTDHVAVRVPATSANLGPGFDAVGIALAVHDVVEVRATTGATRVEVEGEGAGQLPDGEDHLVVRALRLALDAAGAPQAGLELRCVNGVPHGRGLGSSAAAVVAGLVAARGLISEPEALDEDRLLALATEMEGHPDNAAPALMGGATIAWTGPGGPRATALAVADDLAPTVLLPAGTMSTATARSALPTQVPHADAAHAAARVGLLVLALAGRGDLVLDATEDRLHQPYRAAAMPGSAAALAGLRAHGHPAVLSGAGPCVLVLAAVGDEELAAAIGDLSAWRVLRPAVERTGAHLLPG